MKHLGDITNIRGSLAEPVNVIIGGSPCQDLSIAGNRAGLEGERSGLFMDQLRVIKEMRVEDESARGKSGKDIRPRFMVWENVPGAFSSNKGADFGAVLQETARIVVEEAPAVSVPEKGWPTAGCIAGMGDGGVPFSIAWRVFDAQFWGVPQRRRRIALVADFGGLTGPEILFERESLSGDHTTGRTAWEAFTAHAEDGVTGNDNVLAKKIYDVRFSSEGTKNWRGHCYETDVSRCLDTASHGPDPDSNHGGIAIVSSEPTYCIQGNCIDRADTAGCNGKGWTEGVSYTLNTVDRPAVSQAMTIDKQAVVGVNIAPALTATGYEEPVAVAIENHPNDSRVKLSEDNVVQTLSSRMGTGGGNTPMVLECYEVGNGQADQTGLSEVCRTLNCMHDQRAVMIAAVDCRNGTENPDVNGTLQAKSNGGQSVNLQNVCRQGYIVRRLTPLECERLQGYPDGWTDIGAWTDTKDKLHKESADSARYKALGNSIALPPWMYVLQRLSLACGPDHTMASLFDGIGGFPLIWEYFHGKGSCKWASEIEEFPIAVTKERFKEAES